MAFISNGMKRVKTLLYSMRKGVKDNPITVMGGTFQRQGFCGTNCQRDETNIRREENVEKYFRPSCLPILNDKIFKSNFFHPYYDKDPAKIGLPDWLMNAPKASIINYFSVLREAANFSGDKFGGCGTVGMARHPYPIAYHFLTSTYQKKLPYKSYLQSFQGIGHMNLIKVDRTPKSPNHAYANRYFIELETIEGSTKDVTYFAYYYGYMYLQKEAGCYKIADIKLYGEDFLCAAYHLWQHNAEAVIDIKYGEWCKLVKERLPTKQEGYVKKIEFIGTDGNQYLFVFLQLTNSTDILHAQYKKSHQGEWKLIDINPEQCLEETGGRD